MTDKAPSKTAPEGRGEDARPRTFLQDLQDRLEMAGIRTAYAFAQLMPSDAWVAAVARRVGPLIPALRRRVRDNLALVRPEADADQIRRLTADVCAQFGWVAIEYAHLPRIAANPDHVVIEDDAPLIEALRAGRGVMLVSAHFGSWESVRLAARAASARAGIPRDCGLIRRAFNNPRFERWTLPRIESAGTPVMNKGRQGSRDFLRHVARKGMVLFLVDQRQTGAPLIPFLGREAETTTVAAELALRYDAAMIPARGLRLPDGRLSVRFEPEIPPSDPETMMAEANARIGAWIDQAPGQWFWLHRRWKLRPRGEAMRAARAAEAAKMS